MFSIIITTYKRPVKVLMKAINSVLSQSYTDWELIIVNDFHEDNNLVKDIRNLIENYKDNRIKYKVHDKNKGACEARNTGINNSNGEFIAFLDDDDEWCNEKLESVLPYFKDEKIGMVCSDAFFIYDTYEKIHKIRPINKHKKNAFKALLINNYIGSTSFPVMTRKAVIEAGGFSPDMRACQDLDLWLRIARKFEIEYCPLPLTKYYFGDECITKNIKARIESHEKLIKKYIQEYNNEPNLLSLKYLNIAADCLLTDDINYFKLYFNKARTLKHTEITNYIVIIKAFINVARNNIKRIAQ